MSLFTLKLQVRESAYKLYLHENDGQKQLLDNLLLGRYMLAQLVGFETYAHRALRETMAATPGASWHQKSDQVHIETKQETQQRYLTIFVLFCRTCQDIFGRVVRENPSCVSTTNRSTSSAVLLPCTVLKANFANRSHSVFL